MARPCTRPGCGSSDTRHLPACWEAEGLARSSPTRAGSYAPLTASKGPLIQTGQASSRTPGQRRPFSFPTDGKRPPAALLLPAWAQGALLAGSGGTRDILGGILPAPSPPAEPGGGRSLAAGRAWVPGAARSTEEAGCLPQSRVSGGRPAQGLFSSWPCLTLQLQAKLPSGARVHWRSMPESGTSMS